MFEDLKQTNGATTPNASSPSKAPVADMFADVDPNSSLDGMVKPSAVQSGKIKPISDNAWATPQTNGQVPPEQMIVSDNRHLANRKLIVIIAVTLLVLAFGAGAYLIFKDRINALVGGSNTNTNQVVNQNINNNNNQNNNTNTNSLNNNQNINTNTDVATDSDSDGLDDETETTLGTNPLLVDTDNDGLSDRDEAKTYLTNPLSSDTDSDTLLDAQEILVWFTDPNLADTDNDSYTDGQEVASGYNPKGTGKLNSSTTVPGLFNNNTNTNTNVNSNLSQ